jgi:hypothetical protein
MTLPSWNDGGKSIFRNRGLSASVLMHTKPIAGAGNDDALGIYHEHQSYSAWLVTTTLFQIFLQGWLTTLA